jgi:uncharacterized protein YciI
MEMLSALHAIFKAGVEPPVALHMEFSAHLMQPVLQIHLAGPLFDGAGTRIGIIMIMQASNETSIRNFVDSSPYSRAGLYESVSINRFEPEVGRV